MEMAECARRFETDKQYRLDGGVDQSNFFLQIYLTTFGVMLTKKKHRGIVTFSTNTICNKFDPIPTSTSEVIGSQNFV